MNWCLFARLTFGWTGTVLVFALADHLDDMRFIGQPHAWTAKKKGLAFWAAGMFIIIAIAWSCQ